MKNQKGYIMKVSCHMHITCTSHHITSAAGGNAVCRVGYVRKFKLLETQRMQRNGGI